MKEKEMYLTREYLRYVKHLEIIAKRAKERELPKNKVLDEINKKLPITEN